MNVRLLASCSLSALIAAGAVQANSFNRIASFPTTANLATGDDATRPTSAEIIAATPDGTLLAYTDSPLEALGLIDITDPANPQPLGNIALGGEPTSVAILGARAFVAVNTSESYTQPSGHLALIDLPSRTEIARCDLGGQPDSIAASPDGRFLSIAIENERDEDAGDGRVGQLPAGFLVMIDVVNDAPDCTSTRQVDLTGLADIAPEDPEPEFVSINSAGETVVTLQENNHLVVVDRAGTVISHFSAGSVDLVGIDATDERAALHFTESQAGRVREPDAVKWLDDDHFAIANEGDMDGGTRGWSIFSKDGTVVYDSGLALEYAAIEIGHYPDKRSDAKGIEPESVETGTFGGTPYIFIGAERASIVGVYDATDPASPVLTQLLPSGIGPEGYVAIPSRNLLVSANEVDGIEDGFARSHVMLYEYQDAPARYPYLTSTGLTEDGAPVGWGAISGMVAGDDGMLWAVNDSFYGYQPSIFKIDTSQVPARIVDVVRVTRAGMPAQKLDMEGITLDGSGGFWVASEGRTDRLVPHALYHINAKGVIKEEIGLPKELMAVERRFGFEGITRIDKTLWMAVQREWDDDPKNTVKLLSYNLDSKEWGAVRYEKAQPDTGWVGLSEITAHGDWLYVIERDNQIGSAAVTKKIYRIPVGDMQAAPLGGELPVVSKELVRDLLPDLRSNGGYVLDKVEGLAVMTDGTLWMSTDNDGVDDHSGETMLLNLGPVDSMAN